MVCDSARENAAARSGKSSEKKSDQGQDVGATTFFKFTADMAREIRGIKLSASEWRIWSYLATLDPFGDRYRQMPSVLELMTECGVSKSSVYRAMAKFQECNFFDFQGEFKFRNLMVEKFAPKSPPPAEKSAETDFPKSGKPVPNLGNQSQIWETSPKSGKTVPNLGKSNSKTLATSGFRNASDYSDYSNYKDSLSIEEEKEKTEFEKSEEEANQGNGGISQSSASLEDQMRPTEEASIQGQDQNSDAAAPAQNLIQNPIRRDRTAERFNRPAKCEWEANPGEPYSAFIKWRSQHYRDQGGRWAAAATANARSEIRNNPARAADLWQQFLEYSNRAVDNALAARDAGITLSLPPCFSESPVPEKEIVARKLDALNLPALAPTAPATSAAAPAPLPPAPTAAVNNAPDGENRGAYQLRTAADFMGPTSEPPADWAEQIKKQMAAMAEKKSMGRRRTAAFLTERPDLGEAERLFADPLTRPELTRAITRHPEWGYEYDQSKIWEMEF